MPRPGLNIHAGTLVSAPFLVGATRAVHLNANVPRVFGSRIIIPTFLGHNISLRSTHSCSMINYIRLSVPNEACNLRSVTVFGLLGIVRVYLRRGRNGTTLACRNLLRRVHTGVDRCVALVIRNDGVYSVNRHS